MDPFKKVTKKDLQDWTDDNSLTRGRRYQRNGKVQELFLSENGLLVAEVKGRMTYYVQVGFAEGELDSKCSCPVWKKVPWRRTLNY